MKKTAYCLLAILCPLLNLNAQPSEPLTKIPFGARVPAVRFDNIMNFAQTSLKLSDLKRKVVILDFFGTWCGSCIPVVPKLDSLQKAMENKLQIIVVCEDPSNEKVEKFIKKRWKANNLVLPFVLANDTLRNLFPHRMVPHEVWIKPDGTLLATTDDRAVTKENINSIFNGRPVKLPMKIDQVDFDRSKSLFEDNNGGGAQNTIVRSTFTGFIDGISAHSGIQKDTATQQSRLYFLNREIIPLYMAATDWGSFQNRILLEVRDSSRFVFKGSEDDGRDWYNKNSYCYELIMPTEGFKENHGRFMLQDLNRSLHIYGRLEDRDVKCWALVRKNKSDTAFATKSGKPSIRQVEGTEKEPIIQWRNKPVATVLLSLNEKDMPITIDETGITCNIDIDLPASSLSDQKKLSNELSRYGLDIVPVQRKLTMLVISDGDQIKTFFGNN